MCDQQRLRPACAYAQSGQSLCLSLEYSMSVNLLTVNHLKFISLKGGCKGSSESIHVKMPHFSKARLSLFMSKCHIFGNLMSRFIIGPRREKTCLKGFANNTGADQPAHPRSLISAFVIRF